MSATLPSCRYSKAKALKIANFAQDENSPGPWWITREEAKLTNLIKANWNFILDYQLAFYV
ncbi:hypothetical protein HMPREF9102_1749 [Limosilactobacillus oris F0423]|uniref:Uncharacterized protein n=2 Tax=Limosilactobacillus oris TaxID=1632 RepID=E3C7E9_9LACO|nr:hypothetical protein HMPREF9265_1982 [Limosilactobacillus oris PB013-T2-3]EGS37002.1 hypothetical protein HMPREF9102_1749 [Limosilactobacillus oris F0423]